MQNYGQNPGTYYYVNDHLGTPQQLITATGLVVWQATYLPYGEAQVRINLVENNLRFPGQYFDAESGLHYNWNRYYDAQTGRYISADPIGLYGGMNVYAYVQNNPINYFDPEGLTLRDCLRDCALEQLGLDTLAGGILFGLGQPILKTRKKPKGATPGTSIASKYLSKKFPQRLPYRIWSPKLKKPFYSTTTVLGRAIGRWVPFVGVAIIAYDAISIAKCVYDCEQSPCN